MKPIRQTFLSILLSFFLTFHSIQPWFLPISALAACPSPSSVSRQLLSTRPETVDQPGEAVLANAQAQGLPEPEPPAFAETSNPTEASLPAEATNLADTSLLTEATSLADTSLLTEATAPSSAASSLEISAPSALLMEASTGQVLYEKNADEPRSPASITKIMTLILIFDALESGKIQMSDSVTTSAYAKSMGGSQVFLEEGENQTVETLIKCIVIASGNDASVAMAEYIAGSESEFVRMMNERATGLGMTNTHFEDCCGLTDSAAHVTTARDIALMSRELINHYPQIHNYSTIWMDTITHVTKQGSKEFGLSNTNKLLKMATNFTVTGLKTGSTSLAKYCFSGTAEKDGVRLIASIMAAPDYKARFGDALTLLNYGFSNCRLYQDTELLPLPELPVKNGKEDTVPLTYDGTFSYLSLTGEDFSAMEKELVLQEYAEAPVKAGEQAGWLNYRLNGTQIGQIPVRYQIDVAKAGFPDYWKGLLHGWLSGGIFNSTPPESDAPDQTHPPL